MNPIAEDILMHFGTPRHSGRYPWGSGDNPYQRSGDFLSRVKELKKSGLTEREVAEAVGLTNTQQLRTLVSIATNEKRSEEVAKARELRDKGYSLKAIAENMGYKNDSSIRSLLNESSEARTSQAKKTADFLKKQVDEKGMIEVGVGIERALGLTSREKLKQALYILEMEGYEVYGGGVPQVTNPGRQTNIQVLCVPGTPHKDIYNYENIKYIDDFVSHDGGDTFDPKWVYPKSLDWDRIKIRYAEEGGAERDGLVELRRGVDDISLGESRYSQVRILVGDDRYIKGMAAYSDNMPDGVDLIFNTNKKLGVDKRDVLKPISSDPDNPFKSLIKEGVYDPTDPTSDIRGGQSYYIDKNGNKQLSVINKRADEGDWYNWKDGLPSQFLSKQSMTLINKQLNLASADKQAEFDEIMSVTNPTLKKVLLNSFADDCDAAAVHLQAASLPRQKYKVIMPIPSMKDNEVYAPDYENGEKIALVRFPHGGIFEIPILTVNNKQLDAKKLLGNTPPDAIGINSKVAERLSGADFDGDTVMVIPTGGKIKISSRPTLQGLEGFDPKLEYGGKKEGSYKVMKDTQNEMGKISNLISDMTLKGANYDEIAKAVRHSMVVIDAEKHKLDYKQSEKDNDIKYLKKRYQGAIDENGKYSEGASTLITRAKSETSVDRRIGSPKINTKDKDWYDSSRPEGSLLYNRVLNTKDKDWYDSSKPEGTYIYRAKETYINKKGKEVDRTQRSTKMAETDNAYSLISNLNTKQEQAYAEYANKMKSLANQARKEMVTAGKIEYKASAKATYKQEVDSLLAALNISLKNAPRERMAHIIANSEVAAKKKDNPNMNKKDIKKANQQALTRARTKVGAERTLITISDKQWEAIQAGAISENKLMQILNNVDIDDLRKRATPRTTNTLSTAQLNRIASMNASGYSTADIAKTMGVSSSTVTKYLK